MIRIMTCEQNEAVDVCYLGAGFGAVHDSVTAVEGEWILQLGQTLLCELISRVNHPTVRLREHRM